MKPLFLSLLAVALLCGCVQQNQKLYSWGDYSTTLYKMKKNPCDETQQAHTTELKKIIDISKENNMRVPPGVNIEYGYLLMTRGQKDEGLRYFALEKQTYPESTTFITNLITFLAKAEQKGQSQTPQADSVMPAQPEGGVSK